MNIQQEIDGIKELYGEWLEMATDPSEMMACILAGRIIDLKKEIAFWERRFAYECVKE